MRSFLSALVCVVILFWLSSIYIEYTEKITSQRRQALNDEIAKVVEWCSHNQPWVQRDCIVIKLGFDPY